MVFVCNIVIVILNLEPLTLEPRCAADWTNCWRNTEHYKKTYRHSPSRRRT